jgi:hypothetical protein
VALIWPGATLPGFFTCLESRMTTKRESISRRLVDMLVKLSPEEVAETLLETDPAWFDLLVKERLKGKVEETAGLLMAEAREKAARRDKRTS